MTTPTANLNKTTANAIHDTLKDPIYKEKATLVSDSSVNERVEPVDTIAEENVYILFYRHGMNPQCQKGFKLRGDLKAAVERAKLHCQKMGYRYIFVRPLVTNLEDDEKYKDTYGAII